MPASPVALPPEPVRADPRAKGSAPRRNDRENDGFESHLQDAPAPQKAPRDPKEARPSKDARKSADAGDADTAEPRLAGAAECKPARGKNADGAADADPAPVQPPRAAPPRMAPSVDPAALLIVADIAAPSLDAPPETAPVDAVAADALAVVADAGCGEISKPETTAADQIPADPAAQTPPVATPPPIVAQNPVGTTVAPDAPAESLAVTGPSRPVGAPTASGEPASAEAKPSTNAPPEAAQTAAVEAPAHSLAPEKKAAAHDARPPASVPRPDAPATPAPTEAPVAAPAEIAADRKGDAAPAVAVVAAETPRPEATTRPVESHAAPAGFALPPAPQPAHTATPAPDAARHVAVPVSAPTPVQLAPLAIGMMALDGAREFQIRLDPAELGRVDVKLTISDNGRVEASLVVDRVETLAMLQRDARTLERAFDQAGLTTDSSSLNFSLRQDDGSRQQADEQPSSGRGRSIEIGVEADGKTEAALARHWRGHVGPAGVDIRI